MENNKAFIATLKNIIPIKGADNIVKADVTLDNVTITTVVVGKDTEEGSLVAYFDANLALEDPAIELIDKATPGYETEGFVSIGKYLARGNRVRCIKLRGTISNGLVLPVERLRAFGDNIFKEGFSFTELNGHKICEKWVPKTKSRTQGSKKKGKKVKETSRIIPDQFHFHVDTAQLLRNVHKLDPDHIYSISRKLHGTSAICGNVLVKRKLNWREKFLKKIGININDTEYDYIYASRKVIKNSSLNPAGFYGTDLWTESSKKYFEGKLHPSETVYYEIYSYLPGSQKMIQKDYNYGCKEGEYNIAVYRITTTLPDGTILDYDWDQIRERCKELEVPMVEEYYYGKLKDIVIPDKLLQINDNIKIWQRQVIQYLKDTYLEKDATDCKKKHTPDEGIVVRDFSTLGIEVFKLKSDRFTLKESKNKEDEVEDIEEEQ